MMKTRQLFTVIVALLISASVFATETPKMSVIPLKDTKALVSITQETPSVNEVTIKDEHGQIVYYKKSKNKMSAYKKIFNFFFFEEGNYEMTLKAGSTLLRNNLQINQGKVSVQQRRTEVEPYVNYQDNIMKVSFLNYKNEDVSVNIYKDRKLVFTSEIGDEFAIHQAFDLSSLQKGNYEVLLANSDQEYWFSVSK